MVVRRGFFGAGPFSPHGGVVRREHDSGCGGCDFGYVRTGAGGVSLAWGRAFGAGRDSAAALDPAPLGKPAGCLARPVGPRDINRSLRRQLLDSTMLERECRCLTLFVGVDG